MDQLIEEIDRIAETTEFNTQNLLGKTSGSGSGKSFTGTAQEFTFHIGANEGQNLTLSINSMDAGNIGTSVTTSGSGGGTTITGVDTLKTSGTTSQSGADSAITLINNAIEMVSAERSKLGAHQNRLDHTINNLNTSSENLTAAESRVRDVDMAKEMMEQTKNSILSQAAQAMLAQANQQPQGVLQLLR